MAATRKEIVVDFSDFSGGCNSVEHPTRFFRNQVRDSSIGFTLKKSGITKQNGAIGLENTTFTDYLRGLFPHKQLNGTETLYAVSGGELSSVSTSDGTLSNKYTMGGSSNEAQSCDAYGKKIVSNGNTTVKIEGTTAYQLGITAPSGATAAAATGAGLPDGEYSVYVSYARKVSGTNVLYSVGESLGTVTLGSGDNQIAITFSNSSDAQVNNKVVWIKSPDELIHYFFYETNDNTTTSFSITAATAKNTSVIYEYAAAGNQIIPAVTFIFYFAGRLWGVLNNIIYWSDDGTFSVYNIEKWPSANTRTTAYNLTGIFSVGRNLYFNTDNGILILPYGDVNQKEILIEDRWYFTEMRTVSKWNNGAIGLTNQGVRLFDGERFTDFDFAYPIREKLNSIYGSTGNFKPCGYVYRSEFRDEYHLLWQDTSLSVTANSTHAVLNLSSVIWADFNNYNLSWEFKPISGNYAAILSDNSIYIGQSYAGHSKIYYEISATSQFTNVYDRDGTLLSTATDKQSFIQSRHHVENIAGMMRFDKFYCLATNEKAFQVRICAGDSSKKSDWMTVPASGSAIITFPIVFPIRFSTTEEKVTRSKMPSHFWCRSVYVEIKQTDDDINFKLLQLALFGEIELNRYL